LNVGNAAPPAFSAVAPSKTRDVSFRAMAHGSSFARVESIGRTLPEVAVTTAWGQPALKVRGRMFACLASNKAAEPDTLVVMMDFADRDLLVEEDPGTYYLKEHYVGYPCVLVRLARVHRDALRDLLTGAHKYVMQKARKKGTVRRTIASVFALLILLGAGSLVFAKGTTTRVRITGATLAEPGDLTEPRVLESVNL
jgi:hypothetical protein